MSGKNPKEEKNEDCDCFADSRTKKTCPPIRNVTHPLRYYEFTQEEMKALEECDKESFYQRCLPFSTLFATVTYAAIRAGYLQKHPHFGVFPKVMFTALVGYFCGRWSYIAQCDEKLRGKLSANSHLGKILRKYHLDRNPPPKTK
ncbi:unnamed protein product [Arctia plantaginis]|uniref:OCIA domain-containing protein n=1 Tax=Arctia plantaginis TaxID=874455 RepID=A0A8S1BIJ2_ARCPL|nr:unnamed protein product [Arctia plantaginis]